MFNFYPILRVENLFKQYILSLVIIMFSVSNLFAGEIRYVIKNGTGDGSSWETASGSLQNMIFNSVAGDEVWVAKGTYYPTAYILIPGVEITVPFFTGDLTFSMKKGVDVYGGFSGDEMSKEERIFPSVENETILSGNVGNKLFESDNSYHVVTALDAGGILDGFTIQDGYGDNNDALELPEIPYTNWGPLIRLFRNRGAGIHVLYTSSFLIRNVTVKANLAYHSGGGIYIESSTVGIENSIIENNKAKESEVPFSMGNGGGMAINHATVTINNSLFSKNEALDFGGGVYNSSSSFTVNTTEFSGNKLTGLTSGGAGMCDVKTEGMIVKLDRVKFLDNYGAIFGGGLFASESDIEITNGLFARNNSFDWIRGSGIAIGKSNVKLTNCTITDNFSDTNSGTGLTVLEGNAPIIRNTIIWENRSADYIGSINANNTNNFINGHSPDIGNYLGTDLMVNPKPTDGSVPDYSLAVGSPAINLGSNNHLSGLNVNTKDLAGNPRVFNYNSNGIIDVGAYEFQANAILKPNAQGILFVKKGVTGNGTSWRNAIGELADALKVAKTNSNVKQIWVSKGTYFPMYNGNMVADGRNNTFLLVQGVSVLGGFAGTETTASQRTEILASNVTILSGDIGTANQKNDNCYHVVMATGINRNLSAVPVMEGFLIKGGNADGVVESTVTDGYGATYSINNEYGGGFYNHSSALKLENISFEANNAGSGGAVYNFSNQLAISNLSFTNNQASKVGGAISTPNGIEISNSRFTSNSAGEHGGAIDAGFSSILTLDNCKFLNNTTVGNGGAVRIGVDVTATFFNCDFTGNQAENNGGAIRAEGRSKPVLLSSNFSGNFARVNGGAFSGIDLDRLSTIEVCHFINNGADGNGGAVASSGSSGLTIWRSSFTLNQSKVYGGAVYIADHATSQVIDNSIFSKNKAAMGGAVAVTGSSGAQISNVTVVKNECVSLLGYEGKGGGLYYDDISSGAIVNSILWGNLAIYPHNQTDQVYKSGTSPIALYHCTIENLQYGIENFYPALKNIGSNPFLIDINNPIGADNLWFTADDGLKLNNYSPAIDMGSNDLVALRLPKALDFAGMDRISEPILGGIVDMGAYELAGPPSVRYVRQGATGLGYSWENASGDIQVQINDPNTRKILVSAGTYYVTGSGMVLHDNLEIFGGYSNSGSPEITDRDWRTNETILDGNNERSVLNTTFGWAQSYTSSTIFDGFTIKGGKGALGGGIYNRNGAAVYRNLKIIMNEATSGGGGIYDRESIASYENIIVQGNRSALGGGIGLFTTNASFTNSLISGNIGNTNGGVYISFGKPTFNSVTMSGNYGTELLLNSSNPIFKNSIAWGVGMTIDYSGTDAGLDPSSGNNFIKGISNQNGDEDIVVANFFVNPVQASANTPQTGGDYRLKLYSPAINKGLNSYFPNLTAASLDLAGSPRVFEFASGGIIDVGAFEFQQSSQLSPEIRYVKEGSSGSGVSWSDASGDLQATLNQYGVKQVWVAKGTYPAPLGGYKLKAGVSVYGGFLNSGNPAISERNWTTHITTLSGGTQTTVIKNKFTATKPLPATAVLDGFVISGGNAQNGGGIYNEFASPTLTNLIVSGNNATDGGGIYNWNSSPVITNTTISNNIATASGAGMYNYQSNFALNAVVLSGNISSGAGGGMYNFGATLILNSVSILENQSGYQGGGISNLNSEITFNRVNIKGNKSVSFGGGIYNYTSTSLLKNVLVSGNTTGTSIYNKGGGIYNHTSNFKLINGTISGNYSGSGAGIYNEATIPEIYNSLIWANSTALVNYGGALHANCINNYIQGIESQNGNVNYTANDFFANPVQATGTTAFSSGDFKLPSSSPAVNAGSNLHYTNGGGDLADIELAGVARVYNLSNGGVIDLGSYEFQGTATPIPGIRYVKSGSSGAGTSWADASGDLQAMINAQGVLQVWVASGTYYTAGNGLILKNGVEIYGGFPNSGNPVLINRDWTLHETILDGNNERTVVYNKFTNATKINNTAILDGFTITKGSNTNNQANGYNSGGGFYNEFASPILSNLLIKSNSGGSGGGIYNSWSSPLIKNTIISGNKGIQGAGISNNSSSSPKLINVLITGNAGPTGSKGGMSNQYSSSPELINVTISGNAGGAISQGIFNDDGSSPTVRNSIIWGNDNTIAPTGISPQSSNSLIQGLDGYSGNQSFTAEDFFAAPVTATKNNPVTGGDFRLKEGSPAINKGSNILFPNLYESTLDLNRMSRVYNYNNSGIIDAGSYEFQGEPYSPNTNGILFVKKDGIGNGSSWTNPFGELADALKYAKTNPNVLQIWVSAGTYKPAFSPADNNFGTNAGRSNSFLLVKDVKIYGGFAGFETTLNQRDLQVLRNKSILSGDLDPNGPEDARHVVIVTGAVGSAVLDGFTVTGGNANESANSLTINGLSVAGNLGGGIFVRTSSPLLANLIITENDASSGAGMYMLAASPSIQNFVISLNRASSNGGGMYNITGSAPKLITGDIVGNYATSNGGGIYNADASPEMSFISIRGNEGGGNGAGINNASGSKPIIISSLITGNKAGGSGGAIYSNNGSVVVVHNSTIASNSANNGGATYTIQNNAQLKMHNSIVYGNSTGVVNGSGGTSVITYSIVQGSANTNGNVLNADPHFVNDLGYANAPFIGGDYHLQTGSLAINRGDQKTNYVGYTIQSGQKDLDGKLRIINHRVDMGPYEFECSIVPAPNNTETSVLLSSGMNYLFDACKILAIVEPTGDEVIVNDWITAKNWVDPNVIAYNHSRFVGRHYEIKPQNNSASATAVITLYFEASEFENYNAQFGNALHRTLPVLPGDNISYLSVVQFSEELDVKGLPISTNGTPTQITPLSVEWDTNLQLWKVTFPVSGFSGFFITSQENGALPVTLTRFEALKENGEVNLKWLATGETNFSHFEVERSTDARNFVTIGIVTALGGGARSQEYNLSDQPEIVLTTSYYYRLKMVDVDGSYAYSLIRVVTFPSQEESWDVVVYPNPAHTGFVKLKVSGKKMDDVHVLDVSGREQNVIAAMNDDGSVEFSVDSLMSGIYIIQIRCGSSNIWKKLIVIK